MTDRQAYSSIKAISALFSICFLIAVPIGIICTGCNNVFSDWLEMLTSPSPLITDYFALGSLPAAFLNAGVCGTFCSFLMFFIKKNCTTSDLAGYFLVVAHCFYGLNALSMIFPIFGVFIYCKVFKEKFSDFIDTAMMSTAFGPFFSQLLFGYPLNHIIDVQVGNIHINFISVVLCILLALFLGFTVSFMLKGVKRLHRGLDLYNAGLALGLLGLFLFSFLFKVLGVEKPSYQPVYNTDKLNFVFCNFFFLFLFSGALLIGFIKNGNSLKNYSKLLKDTGLNSDFFSSYGTPLTWVNLGFYGLFILFYFDLVILLTDGTGWTGATCGVTLAAITFATCGQHPKNVFPIMIGYVALSILTYLLSLLTGRPVTWSLSTQEYINGLAFATGLCPFAGCYGFWAGIAAGFIDAVICTNTSILHGGLMLYNGGLTAGLTALILHPIISGYAGKRNRTD